MVLGIRFLEGERATGKALDPEGCRSALRFMAGDSSIRVAAGNSRNLEILVENLGRQPWPSLADLGNPQGSVRIGILWFAWNDPNTVLADQRADFRYTLYPGDRAASGVVINPVGKNGQALPPGDYDVRIGLVQEFVAWFYQKGDAMLRLTVHVEKGN